MQIRKNKQKPRLPTVDEFLEYKPKRGDFEWSNNSEDLVEIKVPKFKANIAISFCKIIRRENTFKANMDKIGSTIWENCDGRNSVKDILNLLKKKFPKEENIDQRLFLFLLQMQNLNYIEL